MSLSSIIRLNLDFAIPETFILLSTWTTVSPSSVTLISYFLASNLIFWYIHTGLLYYEEGDCHKKNTETVDTSEIERYTFFFYFIW